MYRVFKRLISPKFNDGRRNGQMYWTEPFQREQTKWLKTHEKMLTNHGHKKCISKPC
jgi:hypothetical protein